MIAKAPKFGIPELPSGIGIKKNSVVYISQMIDRY